MYVYEVDGPGPRIVNGKYLRDEKGFDIKKENEIEPYLAYNLKYVSRLSQSELSPTVLPGNARRTQKPYIRRKSELKISI